MESRDSGIRLMYTQINNELNARVNGESALSRQLKLVHLFSGETSVFGEVSSARSIVLSRVSDRKKIPGSSSLRK
jgi:hypothetical protein